MPARRGKERRKRWRIMNNIQNGRGSQGYRPGIVACRGECFRFLVGGRKDLTQRTLRKRREVREGMQATRTDSNEKNYRGLFFAGVSSPTKTK